MEILAVGEALRTLTKLDATELTSSSTPASRAFSVVIFEHYRRFSGGEMINFHVVVMHNAGRFSASSFAHRQ